MQGHKQFVDKVVLRFRLSERVPKQNLYRRLGELLDWDFLYQHTQALYSHTGQPSLDPVVFFKLVLVGLLENIVSDRRLVEHCALRLDILYFLGYEVDEDLPYSLRPKQPTPTLTVAGKTEATTPIPPASPPTPAHELQRVATRQAKQQQGGGGVGAHHAKAQLLSNKTHQSLSDPEARISVKPGKARALNYLCSLAVDTASGLISHVQADLADSRDSVHLPRLVAQQQTRLTARQVPLREVLADAGYSNGFNYAFLEQRGITPWIPVFGKYKPVVEGFTYEPDRNAYRCPAGKLLSFRTYCTSLDGNWLKNYRAEYRDCQACPLKPTCVPSATQKKLVRSPYDAAYLRAWQRQQSRAGQCRRRVRQGTVEPVFGNLLHHYGLRRVNTKGQAAAHKSMLLSAVAYNLKKLLKYQPNRVRRMALACQAGPQQRAQRGFLGLFAR